MSDSELLTVDEVAAFLRKTKGAVYAMIERGQMPGLVRIGRRVRVRRGDLRRSLGLDSASPQATISPSSRG